MSLSSRFHGATYRTQSGVVLILVMVVLLAMTFAGLALIRSLDTANLIAGNMAFQQSATQSADAGVESAIGWLEANNTGSLLQNNHVEVGYSAQTSVVPANRQGEAFWSYFSGAGVCKLPLAGGVCTNQPDSAGNSVSFMIQRICAATGSPTAAGAGCAQSPTASTAGNNEGAGEEQLAVSAVYYRITVRVEGPRNTMSYVQAVVAM
jgi:Tfp pilus assembly protein PilX